MIEFFRRLTQAKAPREAAPTASAPGAEVAGTRVAPADAIQFHVSSYADPHGRVFVRNGEIFRGLSAEAAEFAHGLFARGIVDELVARKLLIPTKRSALAVEGFALVLEHRRVAHVSYPFEWSGEMLRAAALLVLELAEALAAHGLTLKDAHGWNVLFDGCQPVFVDFGSIVPAQAAGAWNAHVEREFREYFLHPLALIAAGHGRIARALGRDFEQGIRLEDCAQLVHAAGGTLPALEEVKPFAWYRECIAGLNLQSASKGWVGYYDGEFPPLAPDATWTPKHQAVHALLQEFRPATVLDIGANRGWYAMLAAKGGASAVAYDNDEVCINQLFADARQAGLAVQPLVMSCLNPTPRYGLGEGLMESAAERLRSDLVLGLALVHHMVFKMHLNFDQIAAAFAAYEPKVLVVEFPPATDIHVSQWMTPRYAWYTEENFRRALGRYFPKIRAVASHPTPRILLVCER